MAESKSKITLRRLRSSDTDLAELAANLNAADSEVSIKDFSGQSLKEFVADPNHFYLIAYRNDKIAGAIHGYLHLHPTGVKYLYVDEVDTMEGHRRQGVATAMMNEVFVIAKEYGASELWLGTEHDNERAKAFYVSLHPSETENGPIYTWKVER